MNLDRWSFLAGVTGITANVLLAAMFATSSIPGTPYEWTGPANDVIGGIVSTSATIVVALALRRRLGGLRVATVVGVTGMAAIVASSVLLVLQVIPFAAQLTVAVPAMMAMFGWVWAVGRTRRLPRGFSRTAELMGSAVIGMLLYGLAMVLPQPAQYAVGILGGLLVVPVWLVFPVWLIVLNDGLQQISVQPSSAQSAGIQPGSVQSSGFQPAGDQQVGGHRVSANTMTETPITASTTPHHSA